MFTPRGTLFTGMAILALVMTACQPADAPVQRAGEAIDSAFHKLIQRIEKLAAKAGHVVADSR